MSRGHRDRSGMLGKIGGEQPFELARTSLGGHHPLRATARDRNNIVAVLMEAEKTHSLGQMSHALYEVGGEYRRHL